MRALLLVGCALLCLCGVARAEDDLDLARKLVARGIYEPAETLARGVPRPEARVVEALALAGRARAEKAPALLAAAEKLLADAEKKGVPVVRELLTKPAPPRFGSAEEELALIEALRSRGRIGAAEAVIDAAIPGAHLEGASLRRARLIKATLLGERSRHPELGGDAASRSKCFEAARALLVELARTGEKDEEIYEPRVELYELCVRRGQGLQDAAKVCEDLAQRDALMKEAEVAFTEGATLLDAEATALRAAMAAPGATALPEQCLCAASSEATRCLIGRAHAAPTRVEREPLLRKALLALVAFNEEFSSFIEGYESAIDMAEVHQELGESDQALVDLASAYNVAEPGAKLTHHQLEVFARAALCEASLHQGRGKPQPALAILDKALAHAKSSEVSLEKDPLAKVLRIERAFAQARCGKEREALKELQAIAATEAPGPVADLARAKITKIQGGPGEEAVSSSRALELMEEALLQGAFPRAASYAHMALASGKKEPRVAARALLGLARSYEARQRYYEASIAYEEVTRRAEPEVAAAAALGLVKCCEAARHGASVFDDDACAHALTVLTKVDPAAGRGLVPFHRGRKLEDERKFAEAAAELDKVLPEAGSLHDEALYAGAWCRFQVAREQRGKPEATTLLVALETSVEDALAFYAKNDGVSEERRKRRHELEAEVRFLLADVLLKDPVKKPELVITLMAAADPARSPERIAYFKIEAYVAQGALPLAEGALERLVDTRPEDRHAVLACRDVAQALDRAAREMPATERRAARSRAARLYALWIKLGRTSPDAHPTTAESLHAAHALLGLGLDVSGLDDRTFLLDLDAGWEPGASAAIFGDARDLFAQCMKVVTDPGERVAGLACWGESAGLSGDWASAVVALEQLVAETKLLDAKGEVDAAVVKKNEPLLLLYADLALAHLKQGATLPGEAKKGFTALDRIVAVSPRESRLWWKARIVFFEGLDRRGTADDLRDLALALRAAERNYPGWKSAEKFGLVPRIKALQARVAALTPATTK